MNRVILAIALTLGLGAFGCAEHESDLYRSQSEAGDPAQATEPGRGEGEIESMGIGGNPTEADTRGSAVGRPSPRSAGPSPATLGGPNQPTAPAEPAEPAPAAPER